MKCSKCGTEMPDGVKFCSECGSKTNDVVQEHKNEKDSLNHIISELKVSFFNSEKSEENNEQGRDDNKEPSAESSINDIYKNISQKAAHVYDDFKEQYNKHNNSVVISNKKNDSNSIWKGLVLITIFVLLILYINIPKNSEDIKEENQGTAITENSAIEKAESSDTKKNSNISKTKKDTNEVFYSTNTKDDVKNGNNGIYAYLGIPDMYEHYYIIDFDEGYVYSFEDGNNNNDCQKLKIDSGNLKKGLVLTYNGGKTKWDNKLYFELEDDADFLLLEGKDGAKEYFWGTDLNKALELKDSKNIKDYVNKTKDKAEKKSKVSKKKSNAVDYSTNTKDTVNKGIKGIYSYIAYGASYNQYYIIDLDKGYVYYFKDDTDDCERLKIDSGNLNKGITVTYHDGNDKWSNQLHFSEKNESEVLIMEDNDGFETEFYSTNLKKALKLKDSKEIRDY